MPGCLGTPPVLTDSHLCGWCSSGRLAMGSANASLIAGRCGVGTDFLEVVSLKMKKDIAVPLVGLLNDETVEQRCGDDSASTFTTELVRRVRRWQQCKSPVSWRD